MGFTDSWPMSPESMADRTKRCHSIAAQLRAKGYDVGWKRVSDNYRVFTRWHTGNLALGYLINSTGIKYVGVQEARDREDARHD